MNIIYPPLVEDSLSYHFDEKNIEMEDKIRMYQHMIEIGIITEQGLPTEKALDMGWVKDFYEEEDMSFEDFLTLYPVFKRYDVNLFQKIDGFWEISLSFKESLKEHLLSENMSYDDRLQITEYLSER